MQEKTVDTHNFALAFLMRNVFVQTCKLASLLVPLDMQFHVQYWASCVLGILTFINISYPCKNCPMIFVNRNKFWLLNTDCIFYQPLSGGGPAFNVYNIEYDKLSIPNRNGTCTCKIRL